MLQSELAVITGLPRRTIRYYTEKGLFEVRKTKQGFIYDESAVDTARWIVEMKDAGLTLSEIIEFRNACNERRISMLEAALLRLREKKRVYEGYREALSRQLASETGQGNSWIGSSLSMMSLLRCPSCESPLDFHALDSRMGMAVSGDLICPKCERKLIIDDGIIVSLGYSCRQIDPLDRRHETYHRMSPFEISEMQVNSNWILSMLLSMDLSDKVIFENSLDVAAFLPNVIERLPAGGRYILADSSIEALRICRDQLSALSKSPEVLFLLSDGFDYPLSASSVDILIDYYSTEIFQRLGIESLPAMMKRFLHYGSHILGVMTYVVAGGGTFRKNKERYPRSYPGRFDRKRFLDDCSRLGLREIETFTANIIKESNGVDTFVHGDVLGELCFLFDIPYKQSEPCL